ESDGLIPEFGLDVKRARCCVHCGRISHHATLISEVRIVSCVSYHSNVARGRAFVETGWKKSIVLEIPHSSQQPGGDMPFRILEDRFVDLYLTAAGDLAEV